MHEAKILIKTELSHDDFNAAFNEGMGSLLQNLQNLGVINQAYKGTEKEGGNSNGNNGKM